MNEFLISIVMILLFTSLIFSISYIIMKILKINHPKDKFRIYTMVLISILFIFLLSITVVGENLQNKNIFDNYSIKNNQKSSSIVFVIDETQSEKDDNICLKESIEDKCTSKLCCDDELENCNHDTQNVMSFFINSPNDINELISQIKSGKLISSINEKDSEITVNQNSIITYLSDDKKNDNIIQEESNSVPFILLFNIILILLCLSYLTFNLIFGKKIILKNVNAKKCNDSKVKKLVKELCREIKIKTPKIYIFNGEPNAFVFGYPVSLVISTKLINCLSQKELKIALRHELAHISNKDHILKPLLQTMRILFFYNPFVHILYKKMINERELLADSKFIGSKSEKIAFMEILFKINDFRKKHTVFSNNIYGSSSLLLVSNKTKKLEITDRFNHLFSSGRKKSLITTLTCIFLLISNISAIAIAQNSFLNNSIDINEEFKTNSIQNNFEDDFNPNFNSIYIVRLIKQNAKSYNIIVIEDSFCNTDSEC